MQFGEFCDISLGKQVQLTDLDASRENAYRELILLRLGCQERVPERPYEFRLEGQHVQ
jgi:hypothetical protein